MKAFRIVLVLAVAGSCALAQPATPTARPSDATTSVPSAATSDIATSDTATTDNYNATTGAGDAQETRATPAASTTATTNLTAATAAAPDATTPEEAPTSTVDSLAVNLDDSPPGPSLVVSNEDPPATGDEAPESKSIDDSNPDNELRKPSAKLLSSDTEITEDLDQPAPKPKPTAPDPNKQQGNNINMTAIDQYFEARKDQQETVESWQRMGKKLKKGIGSAIGSIVPMALNLSQEAKISSNCSGAMLKWVLSMNQLKSWSLRMLDASGKPIAGMMEGSMTMFGNHRQCLKIRAPDDDEIDYAGEFREYFRGKYCVIQAKPWLPEKSRFYNFNTKFKLLMESFDEGGHEWYDKTVFDEISEWALALNFVNIRYDICVPSLCTREDIQKSINYLLKNIDLKARVVRCETDSYEGGFYSAVAVESGSSEINEALAGVSTLASTQHSSDQSSSILAQFSQLGWLLVPALAMGLVIIATTVSLAMSDSIDQKTSKLNHTIKSLSLKRSVSSHLSVDYDQLADDKPLALYGIRFVLILWVLVVESAVNLKFEYLRELLMLKDLIFWWPMQFIINSTLQFDSIILLTAFTMAYKNCLNQGINNVKAMTRFVIDKYLRLMPSIMLMVALVILLPLVYRGPVWNDYVTKQSAVCQSTGWLDAVFLQNYLPYKEICLPQTWLFCVEFQLVLLMAPIVYYLNKSYINAYANARISVNHRHNNIQTVRPAPNRAAKPFYWLTTVPGALLLACIVIGLASSFYNVYANDLPPTWFYTMADPDSKAIYFGEHFIRLTTHMAVFAMGVLAGLECRRATRNVLSGSSSSSRSNLSQQDSLKDQQSRLLSSTVSLPAAMSHSEASLASNKGGYNNNALGSAFSINLNNDTSNDSSMNGRGSYQHMVDEDSQGGQRRSWGEILFDVIACIIVMVTMAAILFSVHDWALNDLPSPLVSGLYDIGSRLLWSLAMIWILYMVSVPHPDKTFTPLARALGHPAMVCLGKLSFLVYLIHPFVHTAVLAIQEQPIYSSWLMLFHVMIGNITLTVILASFVSLFVEMPCRNLFRRCGTSLLLSHNLSGAVSAPAGLASSGYAADHVAIR